MTITEQIEEAIYRSYKHFADERETSFHLTKEDYNEFEKEQSHNISLLSNPPQKLFIKEFNGYKIYVDNTDLISTVVYRERLQMLFLYNLKHLSVDQLQDQLFKKANYFNFNANVLKLINENKNKISELKFTFKLDAIREYIN